MAAAVQFTQVTHVWGDTAALSGIDLAVERHERVAVVGPSGSGKTTLLELLCGLSAPTAGTVSGPPAALMPQRDLLLPWFDALDNAALGLRIAGASRAEARRRARPLLDRLGLGGFAEARPTSLSGGMRQRIALVRALLADRPVLALDEPFAALDAITRAELQGWLTEVLHTEPRTVVLVTHDVEEAVLLCDRVLVLSPRPGRIVAEVGVPLPYPRRRTDAAAQSLRAQVLDRLGAGA